MNQSLCSVSIHQWPPRIKANGFVLLSPPQMWSSAASAAIHSAANTAFQAGSSSSSRKLEQATDENARLRNASLSMACEFNDLRGAVRRYLEDGAQLDSELSQHKQEVTGLVDHPTDWAVHQHSVFLHMGLSGMHCSDRTLDKQARSHQETALSLRNPVVPGYIRER